MKSKKILLINMSITSQHNVTHVAFKLIMFSSQIIKTDMHV